jgi:predicted Rossmann fold nucleotide-binding protein DprA/Smf involved in DNA uptake
MDGLVIARDEQQYPPRLHALLGAAAPPCIALAGPLPAVAQHALSLFCSVRCPGAMILQTYEFVSRLRHQSVTVCSGFHSPMERECLRTLMTGVAGVVWCLAKSLTSFVLPREFQPLFDAQRLTVLSPFPDSVTRITDETARYRNLVAAALADDAFLSYAAPGGHTEKFCLQLLAWDKTVFTLDAPENAGIIARGAQAIQPAAAATLWPESVAAATDALL